jgi:hypothetical protein
VDPATHLEQYAVKLTKTSPAQGKHAPRRLRLTDQFGDTFVETVALKSLMVPRAKNHTAPVAAPDPSGHAVDHYTCYGVKTTEPFLPRLGIEVVDQFAQPKAYDLKKPTRLCAPADKAGEGVKQPDFHVICFQAAPARGEPKHVPVRGLHVNNQFGPGRLDTVKEEELCLPALKQVLADD